MLILNQKGHTPDLKLIEVICPRNRGMYEMGGLEHGDG